MVSNPILKHKYMIEKKEGEKKNFSKLKVPNIGIQISFPYGTKELGFDTCTAGPYSK